MVHGKHAHRLQIYAIYKASLLFGSLVSLPRAHRIELIGHAYVAYCCVWS